MPKRFLIIATLVILLASNQTISKAQTSDTSRPVDLMIVIDNSCSMFPQDKILAGCTSFGSDPDYFRITGADLFFARLGFGAPNEAEYQAGVVDLGDEPILTSPLKPLKDARDSLAKLIANPKARSATKLVPALDAAYKELRTSPNRKPLNMPAVVLITDGIPWPLDGQSNTDIEKLIKQNQDIPLFIMLLQNAKFLTDDYKQYIQFWQQLQVKYPSLFIYTIAEASQIDDTYNQIVAQLQDTVPTKGTSLQPNAPLKVFVNQYVQRMVVTVIQPANQAKGALTIEDPGGKAVKDNEPGVSHFRGDTNPVEVYSIASPRLDRFRGNFWSIKSDKAVKVFIDREGSYSFHFINPAVQETGMNNVYESRERYNPKNPFPLKLSLNLPNGTPIIDPQPLSGEIIFPNGDQKPIDIPGSVFPDATGTYVIPLDLAKSYPGILKAPGRYILVLNAGSADPQQSMRVPITFVRLGIEIGPAPYIASIDPPRLECSENQATDLTLKLGDTISSTITGKISSGEKDLPLELASTGTYTVNLKDFCAAQVQKLDCSSQSDTDFQLHIEALPLQSALEPAILERDIPVHVFGPSCTAVPVANIEVTAAPTPAVVVVKDTDRDGFLDPVDACPTRAGIAQFNGCPMPTWMGLLIVASILGAGAFLLFFAFPWLSTHYLRKPPKAYVAVC
ncbi:MAG: hypothetical protein ACM3PY_11995, partial [Omnitrophica WOR_2 bacterium]